MKRTISTLLLGAGITVSGLAQADISGEITLTNDYRFRGISQSGEEAVVPSERRHPIPETPGPRPLSCR